MSGFPADFPTYICHIVAVGEVSEQLGAMLKRVLSISERLLFGR